MERISKTDYYLDIAESVAKRGTCLRRNFGSVIVKDDVIISTGYTGAPRGRENCCDMGVCYRNENNIPRGTRYELCLSADTDIHIKGGDSMSLSEMFNSDKDTFSILSVNDFVSQYVACKKPINVGYKNGMIIRFDNSAQTGIKCTDDHKIMLSDFTYKEARELEIGMNVMGYITDLHGRPSLSIKRVTDIETLEEPFLCYDLSTPPFENFAVELSDGSGIFVHNCRSVHSEMNAIINASRDDMLGSTLYLIGIDNETNEIVDNASCCSLCERMVINAGIKTVVTRNKDGSIKVYDVQCWVDNEQSNNYSLGDDDDDNDPVQKTTFIVKSDILQ